MELLLAGDIMVGRSFNQLCAHAPSFNVWGNTLPRLQEATIFGANLETTLTQTVTAWQPKAFNFKLAPAFAGILTRANLRYVANGNNHILDYQIAGLTETLQTLNDLGIAHAGAEFSAAQAWQPAIITTALGKVAFLSAADHPADWAADVVQPPQKGREGIAYVNIEAGDWGAALAAVRRVRQDPEISLLVFSLYAGPNWSFEVSAARQRFAAELLHHGVNVLHGHSAHHVQRAELIHGGVVFYGCGDLLDDYEKKAAYRSDLAFLAALHYRTPGELTTLEILPTQISDWTADEIFYSQVNFAQAADRDWVMAQLNS